MMHLHSIAMFYEGYPLSPIILFIVLKIFAREITHKNCEGHSDNIYTLFVNDMTSYLDNLKESTSKLLETIDLSTKMASYKINMYKEIVFLFIKMREKKKIKTLFTILSQKINHGTIHKKVQNLCKEN